MDLQQSSFDIRSIERRRGSYKWHWFSHTSGLKFMTFHWGFVSENIAKQFGNFIGEFVDYDAKQPNWGYKIYLQMRVKIDLENQSGQQAIWVYKLDPIRGLKLEGKSIVIDDKQGEYPSGAKSIMMKYDMEENLLEDTEGKKRPRVLIHASNVSDIFDSMVHSNRHTSIAQERISAAIGRQAYQIQ
ncbi:hypothetical protein Goshw_024340 [Gossypium schwendimanii]|uniref:Uncharacterized protein n=1 Tax=Gossypium schwendimanii TaxID=34291 RepID=A0A7J9LC75_GOSSC|nr:hypothetical protein [Gossypium schwendimanii]